MLVCLIFILFALEKRGVFMHNGLLLIKKKQFIH